MGPVPVVPADSLLAKIRIAGSGNKGVPAKSAGLEKKRQSLKKGRGKKVSSGHVGGPGNTTKS